MEEQAPTPRTPSIMIVPSSPPSSSCTHASHWLSTRSFWQWVRALSAPTRGGMRGEREREREKREGGKEDKHLTSLEREVYRFREKRFSLSLRWDEFRFSFSFSRISNAVRDVQPARFEYLFRTRGNEKLVNFSRLFDSIPWRYIYL